MKQSKEANTSAKAIQKRKSVVTRSSRGNTFFQDLGVELGRVQWPGRDLVVKASSMVFFIMVLTVFYVSFLDIGFSRLFIVLRGFR